MMASVWTGARLKNYGYVGFCIVVSAIVVYLKVVSSSTSSESSLLAPLPAVVHSTDAEAPQAGDDGRRLSVKLPTTDVQKIALMTTIPLAPETLASLGARMYRWYKLTWLQRTNRNRARLWWFKKRHQKRSDHQRLFDDSGGQGFILSLPDRPNQLVKVIHREDIWDINLTPVVLSKLLTGVKKHPNIMQQSQVPVMYDPKSQLLFFFCEKIPGESLYNWFRQGPNRQERLIMALDMIPQITAGLFFLHKNGISHMDVKPDNVMIYQEGRTPEGRPSK
eukprot:GHVT01020974.1.p1 GENE.GHVT01020974.1~~GHVT01020974.1.p1  ORF type:complete len:278 (+),score=20.88 GHVT01020974.1:563-1396(+)